MRHVVGEVDHVQTQCHIDAARLGKVADAAVGLLIERVEARQGGSAAAKVRLALQKALIGSKIRGIGLGNRDRCPSRHSIGDIAEGLAVPGADVEDLATGRHLLGHGPPQ